MRILRLWCFLLGCLAFPALQAQTAQDAPCRAPEVSGYFPAKDAGKPAVLIFVHGVLGDPVSTWLSSPLFRSDVFWPCLVSRHPAFADTNIYLAGYTTTLVGSAPSIEQAADALYQELHASGVLTEHAHVAFVAHSLGGLEVARMILRHKGGNPDLARKVRFVRFYGTPGLGSSWAAIAASLGGSRPFPDMSNPALLDEWAKEWKQESAKLGIRSFCAAEQDGIGLILKAPLVVTEESAAVLCNGARDRVWYDHLRMVKPRSIEEDTHKLLASSYARCVAPAVRSSASVDRRNTPEGRNAIQWFLGFTVKLLQVAGDHDDVQFATRNFLYSTEGTFFQNNRYTAPRAGAQSLAVADNSLVDANSFANEFRAQLMTELASLDVDAVVPLAQLGEALASSDSYELARKLELTGGFSPADLVIVTRQTGAAAVERVLFFVAGAPAPSARPQGLLRGFALAKLPSKCL